MKFIFKTTTSMKPYNYKKFFVDKNLVDEMTISAGSVTQALKIFYDKICDEGCVSISKNALKNKKKMCIDTKNGPKQIGYVITGKTVFRNINGKWTDQFIDLWIEVLTISDTKF